MKRLSGNVEVKWFIRYGEIICTLFTMYKNYKLDAIKRQTKMRYVPKVRELAPPVMVVVVDSGSGPWAELVLEDDPGVVEVGVRSPLQP